MGGETVFWEKAGLLLAHARSPWDKMRSHWRCCLGILTPISRSRPTIQATPQRVKLGARHLKPAVSIGEFGLRGWF